MPPSTLPLLHTNTILLCSIKCFPHTNSSWSIMNLKLQVTIIYCCSSVNTCTSWSHISSGLTCCSANGTFNIASAHKSTIWVLESYMCNRMVGRHGSNVLVWCDWSMLNQCWYISLEVCDDILGSLDSRRRFSPVESQLDSLAWI